jgi:adenylate cyclase
MGQQTSVLTKFAAVGALDIAGYSRLMALDEAETFARVRTAMDKIVATEVAATGGRIVKSTGDGALVEWPDPAAAVSCALEIQSRNETQERERRPDRRARFRVGLHAGHVIAADGDKEREKQPHNGHLGMLHHC